MKRLLVVFISLLLLPIAVIAAEEAPAVTPDNEVAMVINGDEKKCGAFWEVDGGEQLYVPDGWVEIETSNNCVAGETIEACCNDKGYSFVEGNIGVTLEVLQAGNDTTVVQSNTNDETETSPYVVDESGSIVIVNSDSVDTASDKTNNTVLYTIIITLLIIGFVIIVIIFRRRGV